MSMQWYAPINLNKLLTVPLKAPELIISQGLVQAADYIYKKLKEENLLEKAFNWRVESGTRSFPLVSINQAGCIIFHW